MGTKVVDKGHLVISKITPDRGMIPWFYHRVRSKGRNPVRFSGRIWKNTARQTVYF